MNDKLLIELYKENKYLCELIERHSHTYGINHVQLYILILASSDKRNVSNIATCLNISKSAVSQALVGLLLKRFIVKKYEDNNKKSFYIELTPKGNEVKDNIMDICLDLHHKIKEGVGEEDLNIFVTLLTKVNMTIEKIVKCREDIC